MDTRKDLLQQAYTSIYKNGYQATSIDNIVDATPYSKGAFYYYFKNKEDMGLTVISEIIAMNVYRNLIGPLLNGDGSLQSIHDTFENHMLKISDEQVKNGCPLNNLIHEMSPLNSKFIQAIQIILSEFTNAITEIIESSQKKKQFPITIDSKDAALFIVTGYEGARGLGKVYRDKKYYKSYLKQLSNYLNLQHDYLPSKNYRSKINRG